MEIASKGVIDKSQRWWHLSSIQLAGGLISVPVISIGSQVFLSNGLVNAVFSIVIGNLILLLASYLIIQMSYKERFHAVENASQFIGKLGGRILAFFILICGISWIAWELYAGNQLLQSHPFFSDINPSTFIGAAAALVLLIGIKGLKYLCVATTIPLLILLFMIVIAFEPSLKSREMHIGYHPYSLSGISLVISCSIAAVVDYPTFFRHSRTKKDSVIALGVIFLATSLLQVCGVLLFNAFVEDGKLFADIMSTSRLNLGITSVFLIISMLTSVSWNIYAASVGWESLFPVLKDRIEYAVIGLVIVTLFSNLRIEQIFSSATMLLDVVISGVGGVLILDYIKRKKAKHPPAVSHRDFIYNNLSWFLGSALGLLAYYEVLMTKEDSTFVSLFIGFVAAVLITQTRRIWLKQAKSK